MEFKVRSSAIIFNSLQIPRNRLQNKPPIIIFFPRKELTQLMRGDL